MTLTLALESSADVCAVALVADGETLGVRQIEMSRGHAEALVPLVQDLAMETDIALTALDLIGVTRGPGSFTGVRTGIAAARGFAIASGAPAVGVSSLKAVAKGAAEACQLSNSILCILDTRRSDYFAQMFDPAGMASDAPRVMSGDALYALIRSEQPALVGNAVTKLLSGYDGDPKKLRQIPGAGNPDPVEVAKIAEIILRNEEFGQETLTPLYLREPEAKLPQNGGRLKR